MSYRVSRECRAQHTFDNLEQVRQRYLIPAGITSCQLITDDGSENAGVVKEWVTAAFPSVQHLIAQRDIEFSNSMIEAANKQLKYQFLYHHHISDHEALVKYLQQAIEDFNHRPRDVIDGLTSIESLQGKMVDKAAQHQQMALAKKNRIAENRKTKCCYYNF